MQLEVLLFLSKHKHTSLAPWHGPWARLASMAWVRITCLPAGRLRSKLQFK